MQVHSRIQSTWWFLYLGDYLSPVCILVYCVILIPVTVPETQRNQFLVSTRYQWNHLVHPIIIHHFPDIIRHPSPSPSPSISVNQGPPSRSPSILAPTRLMMALQSVPAWRWWCSVNRIQHGHTFLHPLGSSFLATSTPLLPQWPPTLWSASLGQRHHTVGNHWSSSVLYWSAISYSTYKDTIQLWLSLCMLGPHRAPLATDNLRYIRARYIHNELLQPSVRLCFSNCSEVTPFEGELARSPVLPGAHILLSEPLIGWEHCCTVVPELFPKQ
jgi:hypothetical protein